MDVHNSVTYVGFNTGVISTAAVIIVISLFVLYLIIKKDSTYIFCDRSIASSIYNIVTVSVSCGIFFFFGQVLDFTDYMHADYTLSGASIIVFGAAMFLFYLAVSFIFVAIIKALCKFLYKVFKKTRR